MWDAIGQYGTVTILEIGVLRRGWLYQFGVGKADGWGGTSSTFNFAVTCCRLITILLLFYGEQCPLALAKVVMR